MVAETELAMVQRHVRQGKELISRQIELIAKLTLGKQSTDLAETLLVNFEWIQEAHLAHLNRLIAD